MTTFLLKTEPSDYAYGDLVREKKTIWDGVSNNGALIHIRSVKKGDEAFIYHTGEEKQIVGLATIVSLAYEDPQRPGLNARGEPKLAVFDIKPLKKAQTPVTLAQLKADDRFSGFTLVRQPRLSVMPVPGDLNRLLRKMAGF